MPIVSKTSVQRSGIIIAEFTEIPIPLDWVNLEVAVGESD